MVERYYLSKNINKGFHKMRIKIRTSQTSYYEEEIIVTPKEYKILKEFDGSDIKYGFSKSSRRNAYNILNEKLEYSELIMADPLEYQEFKILEVVEND